MIIGAGAGLIRAAGVCFDEEKFKMEFGDFIDKYGFKNISDALDHKYTSDEERWAVTSKYIYISRFERKINNTYRTLFNIAKDKNYFVITDNLDRIFQEAGFLESKIYYTRGDYSLFQCSIACHNSTYNNEEIIRKMVEKQKNMMIPSELIPICPKCGKQMTYNIRLDRSFVEDVGYERGQSKYELFLNNNENKKVVYLEIGVGHDAPGVIKYSFWNRVKKNKKASYICINADDASFTPEIEDSAIGLEGDITVILEEINKKIKK